MKKIIIIFIVSIACAPFLVFAADIKIYTSFPDRFRVDAAGNRLPVAWCGPCNVLADSLRAKYGKNWENDIKPFVDIMYTSTRDKSGNVIPLLNPDGTMVDQGPEAGTVPYITRVGPNGQIQRIGSAALFGYIDSYREEMKKLMKETEEKTKELAKPKEAPATRAMPAFPPTQKPVDAITSFKIVPYTAPDGRKGFIAVDAESGERIKVDEDGKRVTVGGHYLTFMNPATDEYKLFTGDKLGGNAAKVIYDMNLETEEVKGRDATANPPVGGPDVTIRQRLRPVPDTVLPYLNHPVAVRKETDPSDGKEYIIYRVIIPVPALDKDGNITFTYPATEIRIPVGTPMPTLPSEIKFRPAPTPILKDDLDGPPATATGDALKDAYEKLIKLQEDLKKAKEEAE
ncbi:MAG: hypothetical protein EXS60_01920 [Candidatus Pacebacteria bacterium]|nr:hypothetical protein [Candidatus Paceibacterota bacterium]